MTPDTVHYGPGIKHCIHPAFMEDQLTRALERSSLSYLDVYLLHNPEYYLTHSIKPGRTSAEEAEAHRAEMTRRIYEVGGWVGGLVSGCVQVCMCRPASQPAPRVPSKSSSLSLSLSLFSQHGGRKESSAALTTRDTW